MAKKQTKTQKKAVDTADPKRKKLSNKEYEAELYKLHVELVKLQRWVQEITGSRYS